MQPSRALGLALACLTAPACTMRSLADAGALDAPPPDALDAVPDAPDVLAPASRFCDLPAAPAIGITPPPGFCARHFATVQHARVVRFAPAGELFVASPNTPTSGYGDAGTEPPRIALIADDDHDGTGDPPITFLPDLDACHALLFANDSLYYSSGTQILRMPYRAGQRIAAPSTVVANLTEGASFSHWPHTLDQADDGTIFVSRGGDEMPSCPGVRPTRGAIVALDGTLQGHVVARGLRNPMYLRCQRGAHRCYANELSGDFWDAIGGTEKLVPIRDGDDWGYPCCVTRAHPIAGAAEDCNAVASGEHTLPLHDTPFGLDFAPLDWPAPYGGALFIALHGSFVSWAGARLIAVPLDPATHEPSTTARSDFATGWDDGQRTRGRPADVVFAPDGRLFVANDLTGEILWIAPLDLRAR